jgi:hypothetical protein
MRCQLELTKDLESIQRRQLQTVRLTTQSCSFNQLAVNTELYVERALLSAAELGSPAGLTNDFNGAFTALE